MSFNDPSSHDPLPIGPSMSRITCTCVAILAIATGHAQEKPASADKQKQFAAEAMKKAEVKDARVIETANLVVATHLPEAKAKSLTETVEKLYVLANKALKVDLADAKAKTLVFTFPEVDQYRQFKRSVIKERAADDEFASYDVKRDDGYVAVSARRGEKNPNFEAIAGTEVCRAVLARKAGNARLSEWMKDGFARAVSWRLDSKNAATDRSTVQRLAPRLAKGAKGTPVVDKAWTGTGRDKDVIAASLMDFLTFGSGSEKLGSLLSSMIPSTAIDNPTFVEALKGTDWMVEDLDRAWRDWIGKGSPAGK
jgi:hypothetical protein